MRGESRGHLAGVGHPRDGDELGVGLLERAHALVRVQPAGTVRLEGRRLLASQLAIDGTLESLGGALQVAEVTGDLVNDGALLISIAIGDEITVGGAYAQAPAATLRIWLQSVGSDVRVGTLLADAVELAGTLELSVLGAPGFGPGDTFEFLHAPGGITGDFDAVLLPDAPPGLESVLERTDTTISLRIVEPCPTDLDDSGATDFGDLLALLGSWGACDDRPADRDASGTVDFSDLLGLLGAWGACDWTSRPSGARSTIHPESRRPAEDAGSSPGVAAPAAGRTRAAAGRGRTAAWARGGGIRPRRRGRPRRRAGAAPRSSCAVRAPARPGG